MELRRIDPRTFTGRALGKFKRMANRLIPKRSPVLVTPEGYSMPFPIMQFTGEAMGPVNSQKPLKPTLTKILVEELRKTTIDVLNLGEDAAWEYYYSNYKSLPEITSVLYEHGFEHPVLALRKDGQITDWESRVPAYVKTEAAKVMWICNSLINKGPRFRFDTPPELPISRNLENCILFLALADALGIKAGLVFANDGASYPYNWVEINDGSMQMEETRFVVDIPDFTSNFTIDNQLMLRRKKKTDNDMDQEAIFPPLRRDTVSARGIFAIWHWIKGHSEMAGTDLFTAEKEFLKAMEINPSDPILFESLEALSVKLIESSDIFELTYEYNQGILSPQVRADLESLFQEHPIVALAKLNCEKKMMASPDIAPAKTGEIKTAITPVKMTDEEIESWGLYSAMIREAKDPLKELRARGLQYPFEDASGLFRELGRLATNGLTGDERKMRAILRQLVPILRRRVDHIDQSYKAEKAWSIFEFSCFFVAAAREAGLDTGLKIIKKDLDLGGLRKDLEASPVNVWIKIGDRYYLFDMANLMISDHGLLDPLVCMPARVKIEKDKLAEEKPQDLFAFYHWLLANRYLDLHWAVNGKAEVNEALVKAEQEMVRASEINPANRRHKLNISNIAATIANDNELNSNAVADYVHGKLGFIDVRIMKRLIKEHPAVAYAVKIQRESERKEA